MRVLAIETSCDETAISLVEAKDGLKNPRFKILKNFVASQIEIHRPFGGVVPNLAKREHLRNLPILLNRIMNYESGIRNKKTKFIIPDLIAVTVGPGLEPALWTGINFAKELYKKSKIKNSKLKIIGTSHLEGHLCSFLLNQKRKNYKNLFPAVALLASGGHTILIKIDSFGKYKKLGETRDDAVGECFDKVARILNLSYPGGPEIEKLAKQGKSTAVNFPRPMIYQKNYDFSFSGLKTAVLYYLRGEASVKKEDIAASFQQAAFDVLIAKTLRAAKEFKAKSIMISGGVASNKSLQKEFKKAIKNQLLDSLFIIPDLSFCSDNAAMIAAAGYVNLLRNKNRRLIANGGLSL